MIKLITVFGHYQSHDQWPKLIIGGSRTCFGPWCFLTSVGALAGKHVWEENNRLRSQH